MVTVERGSPLYGRLDDTKGYGFIAAEDEKEYFVHQTGLNDGVVITENDNVMFDIENGDRGPKAVNVSIVEEE